MECKLTLFQRRHGRLTGLSLLILFSCHFWSPLVTAETPQDLPNQKKVENLKFKLRKITLEGNTVFCYEELKKLFIDKINHTVSFTDLEKIAKDITHHYRNKGFVLSRAVLPEQQIQNGVVHIKIVEGYISKFCLETNARCPNVLLQAYGKNIMHCRPTNLKTIERYTLLANDLPGVNIRAVLKPSENKPGTSNLTFAGTEDIYNAVIGLDNRGTHYTGRYELFFGGNINSIFRAGDATGIQALTTNKKNGMHFLNINNQQPLGTNGTQLTLAATYSHSNPGLALSPLNLLGRAYIFTGQVSHPFIRSPSENFLSFLRMDVIHNNAKIFKIKLFQDRITSLRLGFLYDTIDTCSGMNSMEIVLSHGLPLFGATSENSLNLSRQNGHSIYTKATLQLTRIQALPRQFSILMGMRGQYAFNKLLSAEQFTYGGPIYGRAYNPSVIAGDDGLAARLEFRYTQYIDFHPFKNCKFSTRSLSSTIEYYAFSDYGVVWQPLPLTTKKHEEDGASLGVGVRFNIENLYAYGELAQPLIRIATFGQTQNKNIRFFFATFYKF